MGQQTIPDGADHRDDTTTRRPRTFSVVVGVLLCVLALVLVAGGAWALWKDRVDRDSQGFVSFGTEDLRTDQYAIVGALRGDGPGWLYGSDVLGDARVRATPRSGQPLFVGVARRDDALRYLQGVGYATIYSFQVSTDTTHPGGPPAGPPADESIWAASTQGRDRQTLVWTPRSGDWSLVLMNADADAGVDVRGDAGAELPILPWLSGGLVLVGAAAGIAGARILRHAAPRSDRPGRVAPAGSREPT